ncbi:MAG: hypothetical protein JWN31_1633 [Frankiales bacterium]|nr:hypothetical protein [Frankiales bacterium]
MSITVPGDLGPLSGGSAKARTFSPFVGIVIAAVLALVVLPSNFTLPSSSPSPQLAIAPVPPTNNHAITPPSNFTSLNSSTAGNGLGTGAGTPGSPPGLPPLLPPGGPPGRAYNPANEKECVDGRQTEDTLAPPCVGHYEGNNGGATYPGVTATEIPVVVYSDSYTSTGGFSTPEGAIVDIDKLPNNNRAIPPEVGLLGWERFFNYRFQTYNRKVHFFEQFATYDSSDPTASETAATQTQDAANAYAQVHPFAVIDLSASFGGGGTGYVSYMNQHKVLVFGTAVGLPKSLFDAAPGLDYGYASTIEHSASQYADFVCGSLAKSPTSDVGQNANPPGSGVVKNGIPRKFGLISSADPAKPSITKEAKLAESYIKARCGITMADHETYPSDGYEVDTSQLPAYATSAMAKFQRLGVTTVLWPAGYETKLATAAHQANYSPEWITGDDGNQVGDSEAQLQDQTEWAHAWSVTSLTYYPTLTYQLCYVEYRKVDQQSKDVDVASYICPLYNTLRQLFTGIQIAGPNLTPQTVNQGFHAIPAKPSTNPQVPACYYPVGDYTCVKDSAIMHYDATVPSTLTPNGEPGSWRMSGNGKRFLPGNFPQSTLAQLKGSNDLVNQFDESGNINQNPPTG